MTPKAARTLKVGEHVMWDNNTNDHGIVTEVMVHGVVIVWDSLDGPRPLDFRDCHKVSRLITSEDTD